MNAELLYTSAPHGLKQGSRGFCTVLSTVGMPLNLATKLESLSGYRHLYPSGTPDASKNPVSFSHLRFTVGGRQISVLSRISDYGLDYSQRTNKLAHHIVVDGPMPTCGPAALLAESGVMRDHWDGQCVNVPSAPALPALSAEPGVCRTWESITGDAGWGGVVANAWLSSSPRPVFILFGEDQSTELLVLIHESLALLPSNKRWQATFGTYVTTLPPDVECRVRCVLSGSDEARMASARGTVIDLTSPLGQAASSEAVDAARKGVIIGIRSVKKEFLSNIDKAPNVNIEEHEHKEIDDEESKLSYDFDPNQPFGVTIPPTPPKVRTQKPHSGKPFTESKKPSKNLSKRLALVTVSAVVLSTIVFAVGFISKHMSNVASISNQMEIIRENSQKKNFPSIKQPSNTASAIEPIHNDPINGGEMEKGKNTQKQEPPEEIVEQQDKPSEDSNSELIPPEKKKLDASKIRLIQSDPTLSIIQNGAEEQSLKLLSAIPGSRIAASLFYESADKEELNRFENFLKNEAKTRWTWYFSSDNGENWVKQSEKNSSFIEIASGDRPNSRIKLQVAMENSQDFFDQSTKEPFEIIFNETISKEGFIEIDLNDLLKQGERLPLKPQFPPFLANEFDIGFLPMKSGGISQKRHSKEIPYNDLISVAKSVDAELDFFEKWKSVLTTIKSINSDRDDLKKAFDKTSRHFRKLCTDSGEIPERFAIQKDSFIWGKMLLRENGDGLINDIGLHSDWSSEPLKRWLEFMQTLEKKDLSNLQEDSRAVVLTHNFIVESFQTFWMETERDRPRYSELLLKLAERNIAVVQTINSMQDRIYEFPVPLKGIGIFEKQKENKKFLCECSVWFKLKIHPFHSKLTNPTINSFLSPYANAPPLSATGAEILIPKPK